MIPILPAGVTEDAPAVIANVCWRRGLISEPGEKIDKKDEENVRLKTMIDSVLQVKYETMHTSIEDESDFYHMIYDIVEQLNEEKGSMQFKTPSIKSLKDAINTVIEKRSSKKKGFPLTKEEVKEVITRVVSIDRLRIGQASRDIFLNIFGIPMVGLVIKRIIPGPFASISDEFFIPAITSATVVALTKTNKL
ncbi:hypothetical protein HPP92_011729 [Vanilla planifolia]|uniref:Uncharacterized protein n=1 Tax=Vanilla planifolia TaxID=51239 RepID=A0A835R915_VANPL|nr:hypothetical protein HPP92_011729 [Vanilla planifolia]